MKKQTNLKAVEPNTEKLTWEQIDTLARALAVEVMMTECDEAAHIVMLLMSEISTHPFDHSHVETVANLLNAHLFAVTVEAEDACRELLGRERPRLLAAKGGK